MRKLYCSLGSPFARKVRIVLAEKGLEYEADVLNAIRPVDEIAPLNPNLVIPVLVDGDQRLFETNLIVEYLLATYPEAALDAPPPPLAATMTRPDHHWEDGMTLATLESMGDAIANLLVMRLVDGVDKEQSGYLKRQAQRIGHQLDWLESRVTDEGFIRGVLSIQDISLICHVGCADAYRVIEWRGRPGLEDLVARHAERPSIRETVRPPKPPERMTLTFPGA